MSANTNWVPLEKLPEPEDDYEYIIIINGKGKVVDKETYLRYWNLAWNPPVKKMMGKNIITTITSNDKKIVEELANEIFNRPCYPYKIHAPVVTQDGEFFSATVIVAPERKIDLSPVDVLPMRPRRVKKRRKANQKDFMQNL